MHPKSTAAKTLFVSVTMSLCELNQDAGAVLPMFKWTPLIVCSQSLTRHFFHGILVRTIAISVQYLTAAHLVGVRPIWTTHLLNPQIPMTY